MKDHVDLVGVLYTIAGGLGLLVAAALFSLGLGAVALTGSRLPGEGPEVSVLLAAGAFAALAGITLVGAMAHLWTGVALRRHGPWARATAIVLAALDLFILPFGTALGIYALWVLMNDQSRPLFHPETA